LINKIKADNEGTAQGKKKKSKPSKEKSKDGYEVDDVDMTAVVLTKNKYRGEFPETAEAYMIFVGPKSARARRRRSRSSML
jgi:hypothetical protein